MKKPATKQALKDEVRDLLKKQSPTELRSLKIILAYNGKFKLDRYTISIDPEHDEHYGFSMPDLSEQQVKSFLEDPDTVVVIYQRDNAKYPEWLKRDYSVEVAVNDIDLIDVEKFFNYEYTPLVFPKYKVSDGHFNYWDHQNDPDIKWWGSEGRKLWRRVTSLWLKTIEDREEKATRRPVFRASRLYM